MAVQIPFATVSQLEEAGIVEDAFLIGLLKQCQISENEPAWLQAVRQQAAAWVARLRVPTNKDEEWRFTDLSSLVRTDFIKPIPIKVENIASIPEALQSRLVFVNGVYSPELSDVAALPKGVYVGNLNQLPQKYPIEEYFAKHQDTGDVFTSLNTAGCEDIAVVWVEKNVVLETPIHLVFVSATDNKASFSQPRTLVVAERGADLSIVEEYSGTGVYFTNAVTEIWVGENAGVKHTRLQQESEKSFHISKTAVSQACDSRYTINEINFGGRLSRHNPEILQQGEQTQTSLHGLTITSGEQLADTHSIVALTKPYGTTNQLHKCIVGDRAHTVFNGKIFVPKEAQLTNAAQLNRNLLLSPKARVNTKPELQITADNVKCSHGATVSQLEADEIFYLRSRGLSEDDARHLLIDAFAKEIIERIPVKSLQEKITQIALGKTQ
ncbi:Fe-S cluster assembly protein SufD [Pleurocapsales cyanobacterium LEGE 06147]|nr:Fe-S cluster assembly protein SufD [Pleurocapsales cyanobacterium LEGE 06147]